MARVTQGGTKKWCPNCNSVQVCTAVNPSSLGYASGQRWYRRDHSDIQWFRRGLVCQKCRKSWLTAELPEEFLDELVELRNALKEVKLNAESYIKEAESASARLTKLSTSLAVLRALKVYKNQ
ncbi:hypothetical protein ACFPIJ_31725 [Dactylosporangium cerinum]|uniref:Uncharacterized protein n=1 Tax=Dactylosporangium cerinum TaxID=1434730 RepID=A0ABV9W3W4_9ACTN